MKYFIVSNSDGDTTVDCVDKEELLKRIAPEEPYYGQKEYLDKETLANNSDTNYWREGSVLIIKGEIVIPQTVEVVKKMAVD